MGLLSPVLRAAEGNTLIYRCPGCGESHVIQYGDGPGPRWGWDGNESAPTFTPSILVTSGHYAKHHKPGDPCWCSFNAVHEADGTLKPGEPRFECGICHCFIKAGRIEFLSDCTHKLAGQTVDMVPFEDGAA